MPPSEISSILKTFSKFLDPKIAEDAFFSKKGKVKKLQTIDDVLELPIYSYNFLNESDAKIIEELLEVFDIGAAAKLNKDDPFSKLFENLDSTDDPIGTIKATEQLKEQVTILKQKFPDLESKLKKMITVSSLLLKVKEEEVTEKKTDQKVIAVGLDNAGKTAILSKFGGRLGITDLAKLQPTKGVERKIITSENLSLYIWDMGGQEKYRMGYLENYEQYFLEVDLLLYVIDIQDPDRLDESFIYFRDILKILNTLEENPHIIIFLHKCDPDIKENPNVLLNVELAKSKIQDLFKDNAFNHEVYLTSIYSLISKEPQFSRYIKDLMSATSITDPTVRKVDGLGRILEETMNALIRLSESISLQLTNMDERLRAIETGAVQMAETGEPARAKGQMIEQRELGVRTSVLGELRDLFAKKKRLDL